MPLAETSVRAAAAAAILFVACPALAQDLEPAICAVEQVVSCAPFEPCERTLPGAVNLPVLMRVQPGDKTVASRLDDGTERRSDAHTVVATADALAVQGVDDGEPWALWIDRALHAHRGRAGGGVLCFRHLLGGTAEMRGALTIGRPQISWSAAEISSASGQMGNAG
jgi:hypothetical protein